jgi:hypothetical protein
MTCPAFFAGLGQMAITNHLATVFWFVGWLDVPLGQALEIVMKKCPVLPGFLIGDCGNMAAR